MKDLTVNVGSDQERKEIKSHAGLYEMNINGDVYAIKTGRKKSIRIGARGYKTVNLYKNNKCKTRPIHRLIAENFVLNPQNKPCINHIDGDKLNNNISNLEWCTYSENTIHSYKNNLQKTIPILMCDLNGVVLKEFKTQRAAAKHTGIDYRYVNMNVLGRVKNIWGYVFKFKHDEID